MYANAHAWFNYFSTSPVHWIGHLHVLHWTSRSIQREFHCCKYFYEISFSLPMNVKISFSYIAFEFNLFNLTLSTEMLLALTPADMNGWQHN